MRSNPPACDDWAGMGVPRRYVDVPKELNPVSVSHLLWGPPGSGKTYRAVALMKGARVSWANSARFLSLPDLQLARRTAVSMHYEELPGDEAMDRGIVVMDDLARDPRLTDFWEEFVSGFIMSRYNAMKATIFTSNFSPSDVSQRLGDHITDRIMEMCGPRVEKMAGKDWRAR